MFVKNYRKAKNCVNKKFVKCTIWWESHCFFGAFLENDSDLFPVIIFNHYKKLLPFSFHTFFRENLILGAITLSLPPN